MQGGITMSERPEGDLMEDLGYDEAEGAAEMGDEEGFDEYDAMEEADLGEDEYEGMEEGFEEGFEEEGFEEGFEDFGEEADLGEGDYAAESDDEFLGRLISTVAPAIGQALGAEDSDEFFRRLANVARRVGRTVGNVARVAAPIARLIPHPYAQIAAQGLGLLSRLRAEGASEEEAMDAFAELAVSDESAIPILAGLAARSIVRARGARISQPVRTAIVRNIGTAARSLVRRRGPAAIRALPRIVRSVKRTAAVRRTPVQAVPRIVRRTAANVARNRGLARRLSKPLPTPAARRTRRTVAARPVRTGMPRTFTLRGPVRVTLTSVA
jgi:hypothetical protein